MNNIEKKRARHGDGGGSIISVLIRQMEEEQMHA
jgi:hypothetical protein